VSDRDDLANVIFPALDKIIGYRGGYPGDADREIADRIIAAGYGKVAPCTALCCGPHDPRDDEEDSEEEIARWKAAREAARKKEQDPNG